jgi:hypothetical protein
VIIERSKSHTGWNNESRGKEMERSISGVTPAGLLGTQSAVSADRKHRNKMDSGLIKEREYLSIGIRHENVPC